MTPHPIHDERTVMASAVADPRHAATLAELVEPDDLYDLTIRRAYLAALDCEATDVSERIEAVAAAAEVSEYGWLRPLVTMYRLRRGPVAAYACRVTDAAEARRVATAASLADDKRWREAWLSASRAAELDACAG